MGKVSAALGETPKESYAIDAAGNPVALQEHQALPAAEAGYTPVSGEYAGQLQNAQENKDYVDEHWGTAGTLAAGLGQGLTLNQGAAALSALGLLDKGHFEAAQQTLGYKVGDVAGMLLPAFLSGGESIAARGALGASKSVIGRALALSPAGLLGEAGGAAERLAARFLPEAGIMGKLGAPVLKMAARGAAEGAIVNLSHTVADNVIQNKPLAAQALLASGVDGALFGGLTGGILGGVSALGSAGIDMVSGRVAGAAAGGGEHAAATALKRLGASEGKLGELGSQGSLVEPLKGYYKVLQDGGESLASDTGSIRRAVAGMEKKYSAVADDALAQLQRAHPSALDGRLANMSGRIRQDLEAAYGGTAEYRTAMKLAERLEKDMVGLAGKTEKLTGKASTDYLPEHLQPKGEPTITTPATWQQWAKTREQLADRLHVSKGVEQEVYKTALAAYDSELVEAMQKANPELATTFQSATTGARQARELVDMTNGRAAHEAARGSSLHMNGADAATMGYSVLAGANPLVGAGIIAGKKIVGHVQQAIQPAVAEAAYRSAIGANAAHAQMAVSNRAAAALKTFMTGARLVADKEHAESRDPGGARLSYGMKNYQASMALADELTSAAHQEKVRELTHALAVAGHPDLAEEMAMTYGRAAAYIAQNQPKGKSKEYKMGTLGKPAKQLGLSTQDMKFMRQLHAIRNVQDAIIGGLERGDLSRDAVATAKYVFPDYMNMITERATNQIMVMKEEGKFLAADKVAMLGTVLDAPVDSTLQPEFIKEVQQGLAANKAPPPDQGAPQAPQTDVSSYQTPLQSSIG